MDYDSFAATWLGRRVDYDHLYNYQCVDLVLQGLHDINGIGSGVSGNAIDYWNKRDVAGFNQPLKDTYDPIQTTDVHKGDIVILNGLPGNPYGHIGWATGNINGTDFELLEQDGQNGDGDGGNPDTNPSDNVPLTDGNQIRTRYIPKVRVAGVWRPKPTAPLFVAIAGFVPKEVELKKDAYRYNLTYSDIIGVTANHEGISPAGTHFVAQALVHHHDGYDYYMPNTADPSGFLVQDCQDYVAPVAATPIPVKASPPAAPKAFPAAVVPFQVTKTISGYMSASAAASHTGNTTSVATGAYYVFKTDPNGSVNVTRTVGIPGIWINPNDMVEVPAASPEQAIDWRGTLDTTQAGQYICIANTKDGVNVYDLENKRPTKKIQFLDVVDISGFFTFTDGKIYGRPKNAAGNFFWYGIPAADLELYADWYDKTYDVKTTVAERKVSGTLKADDYAELAKATVEKYARKAMDIFIRKTPK